MVPEPLQNYILPVEHEVDESYTTAAESKSKDGWKLAWRDGESFEKLSEQDAEAILPVAGSCHHFNDVKTGGITISGACGHTNKGMEFHWL